MSSKKYYNNVEIKANIILENEAVSRALTIDATGKATSSTVTTTELGYVSGVTSSIQTQVGDAQADATQALNDIAELNGVLSDTNEPTGFSNRIDSDISFADGSRTFTIEPSVTSFDIYVKGTKYVKSAAQTLIIPNASGNHYIYYNAAGVLESTTVFSSAIIEQFAFVAIVYWNTSTSSHTYFADERHGITMDGVTHAYLHTVFGARYLSGLALLGFSVDGTGNVNSNAQFTADSGSIRDEDILHQSLAQAQIPVLYRDGLLWKKKAADAYPVIYSGTAGYTGASGRLPFNEFTGGAWQLTEVPSLDFVLVHFFATNDIDNPIVAIQGTASYATSSAARTNANLEISTLSGMPFAEFVPMGSVIFQTATGYTNATKSRVRSTDTGAEYVDFRGTQLYTPAGEASSHGLLSGLSADDHLQYHTDARGDIRYYTKSQVDSTVSGLQSDINSRIPNAQKGAANGVASLDANSLIPVNQIPPAALERLVIVADQTARFALTTATVQNGDTVLQTDTSLMYFVKDDTNLGNAGGYAIYSAGAASSVAWGGITGIPAPVTALLGTNTGDQTITLTGDVTGSGTGSFATTLANTAVTPTGYGSATQVGTFTVDSKGRLTAASNTSIAIPASQVSDFNEAAQDTIGAILVDSSSIDFTYSDATPSITAVVLPAGVDHDSLQNFVANEHVDHSTVSIATAAGTSGLSGGGNITATRNIVVDITGTTALSATPDAADTLLVYDASATALKKVTYAELLAGVNVGSAGDISETSFSIANNQAVAANVTGLAFAAGVVRSFEVLASVEIDASADLYETFKILGIHRGTDFQISVEGTGDNSLITFSITTGGQVQYTSGTYAGFVSGTIKFRALTLTV